MRRAALSAFLIVLFAACLSAAMDQERVILTGVPPLGPTWWKDEAGANVPAGCGPEAGRLLLSYYDRRYGYRFVRDDPAKAIKDLHARMGTVTVFWAGTRQGLTWPWAFAPGLRAYIEARCPRGASLRSLDADLRKVFETSVALIQRGEPHVILFDWGGEGGIFPNHYAVVVGYDTTEGRQLLVLNPGWGYDFQLLDMRDPMVAPATLFWIEEVRDPPDAEPGIAIGPASATGMWERDAEGLLQLRPVLRLHNDPRSTVRWAASSHVQFLVAGADDLAIATWDSR